MDKWIEIRHKVKVDGVSKRSIQREHGMHFLTVQKILEHPEPPGYRRTKNRPAPKIGPYLAVIASILAADKKAPRKQKHTATRIFERLRDEYGYDGGYTQVRVAVRRLKQRGAEVFVPLEHHPGEAQVDYGFAEVDIAGVRRMAAFFVMSLPYSDAFFLCAFPRECTETFQQGHVLAFEFFGGVPFRISYDNSKVAVIKVGKGRQRVLTEGFLRLQSHYLFKEHFCLVRRPNEKGHVESLVGYGRRNFMVPVPRFDDWAAFNTFLTQRCEADLDRQLRGQQGTKRERLVTEQAAMLPLPKQHFEARRLVLTHANSLSLVRFDRNDYSVPTQYAHRPITAVGGMDEVKLIVDDRLVARHRRSWDKHGAYHDPTHYLGLLERKPGAFDYARPLRDWCLPESFALLRRRLESQWDSEGTREYIKVLRLLETCTLEELRRAIEKADNCGATDSEAIRLFVEASRDSPVALFNLDGRPQLKGVCVADVDLDAYAVLTKNCDATVEADL